MIYKKRTKEDKRKREIRSELIDVNEKITKINN